ncbi:MAG: HlyD family efflux transporter periplasmic adaptor subunit [Bacteroidota bacterium]
MKKTVQLLFTTFILFWMISCKEQPAKETEQTPEVAVKTGIVSQGDIQNIISFNGKTIYLKKNSIISPISGYIVKVNVNYGDVVQKNDLLFEIQTKEKKALGNSDSSLSKVGIIKIFAPSNGIINELSVNQSGVYVSDGSSLCTITENKDLMFQLNVPFEFNKLMKIGSNCQILLSDKSILEGTIFKIMPTLNEISQTQNILIKPNSSRLLPENLNVRVNIKGEIHRNCMLVDKKAVLTDEVQEEFWVLKIVNNKAIKVPIIKGFDDGQKVEITSSSLKISDTIIIEGGYGLSDSTVVKIEK